MRVAQNVEPLVHNSLEKYYQMFQNVIFYMFLYKYGKKNYPTVQVRETNTFLTLEGRGGIFLYKLQEFVK